MFRVVKDWRGTVYLVGVHLKGIKDPYQPTGRDWYSSFSQCQRECLALNKPGDMMEYRVLKYTFQKRR